ncbi:Cytochrome P450 [Mycena sanguinolenta]|uniref:Cytochrome P450 n=1 Tax=Mycena sanguinolenta TaxID=230812 RepID=A0A8H6Y417_9AGAR|nr:Cytochrome P450 [Mycena sanguinolenta]
MSRVLLAAFTVWLTKLVVDKTLSFRSAVRGLSPSPYAGVLWLHPFRNAALLLGSWFPTPSQIGSWYAKFTPYAKHGSTALASVVLWGSVPTIWLADAEGIKIVTGEATVFQKDVEAYEPLTFYGDNVVSTEGAKWRRHRKVANPAFNEVGNAFVWVETVRVVNEWFTELDATQQDNKTVTLDAAKDLIQVTLLVISSAGFGRRASWRQDASTVPPPGQLMAFRPAVFAAVGHLFTKVLTPQWLYALAERIYIPVIGRLVRDTNHAYEALRLQILDLVALSRAWVVASKVSDMDAGLLRNLVEANMATQEDEDVTAHSYKSLTDDELLSNSFSFLLAGHETTAHSLSFAVALLALYPDVQQKIYEETCALWPDGTPTTASASSYKESMPRLSYTLAMFHETIRLFPAIVRLAKQVHADATIPAHRFTTTARGEIDDIQDISISVKAGSVVMVDILGLHMNPMYWGSDVADFKPERFVDTESYRWPRDAFVAFSAGPRNCIGQRFALTESVCFIASLARNYEISVPQNLRMKSFEEQKREMLRWRSGVTMTPTNCVRDDMLPRVVLIKASASIEYLFASTWNIPPLSHTSIFSSLRRQCAHSPRCPYVCFCTCTEPLPRRSPMSRVLVAAFVVWLTKVLVDKTLSFRSAVRGLDTSPYAGVLWLHPFRPFAQFAGRWFPHSKPDRLVVREIHAICATRKHGSWLEGIKTITGEATVFQKDVEAYKSLNFYGENILGTEGAKWRRHRKVANPAFNETGNAFVWMETVRVVNQWFVELDAKQDNKSITLNAAKELLQVTLLVISSAGFGRRVSWHENTSTMAPPGQLMAFGPAVFASVKHRFTKVLAPRWLYALAERAYIPVIGRIVQDTNHAYAALKMHILDLVALSRAWVVAGKVSDMDAGLLRNLVEANMAAQGDEDVTQHSYKSLTDGELLSDSFSFLFAGHETTAHSVSFAVALLALYPDVQRRIYDETHTLWPDGVPTTASALSYKESMPRLPYTLATFHETIRLFPAVVRLLKQVHADATIPAHRFTTSSEGKIGDIQDVSVSLKTGSVVMIDILGLHMNPMYWGPDVADFKPERFLDTESYRWPRDAFVPFSTGPRNCIGQRFALTEGVCLIASLVRNYEISVPQNLRVKPFEEQKREMLRWRPGVSMTPTNCVVSLRHRS